MSISTLADRLARAVEIGRELGRIDRDPSWHALSREGWTVGCLRLAGWDSLTPLEAARARLEACPHLFAETRTLARLWAQGGQDRPARSPIYLDGDRFPAMYAERMAVGLSAEACSAVAAVMCAEMRPDASFGGLGFWSDLEAKLRPLHRELDELDVSLGRLVKLVDIEWRQGKPFVSSEGHAVELSEHFASGLASALAKAAAAQIRALPAAA